MSGPRGNVAPHGRVWAWKYSGYFSPWNLYEGRPSGEVGYTVWASGQWRRMLPRMGWTVALFNGNYYQYLGQSRGDGHVYGSASSCICIAKRETIKYVTLIHHAIPRARWKKAQASTSQEIQLPHLPATLPLLGMHYVFPANNRCHVLSFWQCPCPY